MAAKHLNITVKVEYSDFLNEMTITEVKGITDESIRFQLMEILENSLCYEYFSGMLIPTIDWSLVEINQWFIDKINGILPLSELRGRIKLVSQI